MPLCRKLRRDGHEWKCHIVRVVKRLQRVIVELGTVPLYDGNFEFVAATVEVLGSAKR
jgi:hypothetical protein